MRRMAYPLFLNSILNRITQIKERRTPMDAPLFI